MEQIPEGARSKFSEWTVVLVIIPTTKTFNKLNLFTYEGYVIHQLRKTTTLFEASIGEREKKKTVDFLFLTNQN